MNFYQKKKWLSSGLLLACAVALSCTITITDKNESQNTKAKQSPVAGKAGVVASLEAAESASIEQAMSANLQVEKTETVVVAAKTEAKTPVKATKKLSKTEKQWQNKVMAVVEESLSIREDHTTDSQIVGKMYPTSVAKVVKKGKVWTKITSGSVEGYVKNEYLVFGTDAYKHAKKVCKTYATVQVNGLRVRNEASEDASILTTATEGKKLEIDAEAKKEKGWAAVKVGDGSGYVKAEYVEVAMETTKAVSIEEELAAQKAKEEAEAAKAAQEAQQAAQAAAETTPQPTQNEATPATVDDETLLAAIIMCEAGNEPYTGQVAVGAVVCNRVRSGSYPNTISGVIYQRCQFSPAGNGRLANTLASGNINSSCRRAAAEALAGLDPTNGAHSFHRANGDAGLVIGNHVFF